MVVKSMVFFLSVETEKVARYCYMKIDVMAEDLLAATVKHIIECIFTAIGASRR